MPYIFVKKKSNSNIIAIFRGMVFSFMTQNLGFAAIKYNLTITRQTVLSGDCKDVIKFC